MENVLRIKEKIRKETHERNLKDFFLRLRCLDRAGEDYPDATALKKSLAFLHFYQKEFSPFVNKDMYFAGIVGYFYLPRNRVGLVEDIGHYCANYKTLIDRGVNGIRAQIIKGKPTDAVGKENKKAFLESLDLFVAYMLKHAEEAERQSLEDCDEKQRNNLLRMASDIRWISVHKPKSFMQGIQLIWFAHSYILLKPYTNTITFGNLDRILGGLYETDVKKGLLDREEAVKILCHFILSIMPMNRDTQNISLGGSDENGNYFENDLGNKLLRMFYSILKILFMKGILRLQRHRESISFVRGAAECQKARYFTIFVTNSDLWCFRSGPLVGTVIKFNRWENLSKRRYSTR